MDKGKKNIAIIEPSEFIHEGISVSLIKKDHNYSFFYIDNFKEFEILHSKRNISVVLLNPTLIQNKTNDFLKIRGLFPEIYWIGIIYSYHDKILLNNFDDTFSITDDVSVLSQKIDKFYDENGSFSSYSSEDLTEREIEILKYLTQGMTNKEAANKLNISIHTVNTHRKNIISKTGIKSLPGLTIYAVSKGILSLETPIP